MNRAFFIETSTGTRRLTEADFPVSVGGSGADIELLDTAAENIVAHIGLSSGHAFVQTARSDVELFHNHEFINKSNWLKSGDRVQHGDRVLCWDVKGDRVSITVRDAADPPEIQPPPESPPDEEMELDTVVMPVTTPLVSPQKHRKLRYVIIGLFSLLSLVALFVLFATPMEVRVNPEPESLSVDGFPPPVLFGKKKLVVPGTFTVRATLEGYQTLEKEIQVSSDGFQSFELEMQELPGRLQVLLDPDVPFSVSVDGVEAMVDSGNVVLLERGLQQLTIQTDRYLAENVELEISGFGEHQEIRVSLLPAWAVVQMESVPSGATVTVDELSVGTTPLMTEIIQGKRLVELSLEGYKNAGLAVDLVAGSTFTPDVFVLEPNDGKLDLTSRPAGATVSVNGKYFGSTPLELVLASGVVHKLRLSRPGYQTTQKSISLKPDEEQQLKLDLKPEYGVVFVGSIPADASLTLDGKPAGNGTQRLRLTTRQHELTFSKPGYLPQTVKITPRVDSSQNVDISLKTEKQVKVEARTAVVRTAGGQEMHLLEPGGSFEMGASRREAGRRANESQRLVEITKPFYLSVNEVSNAEYRLFNSKHNSGLAEGMSLNNATHPVVNISWDDAARYCNWLSEKDTLPPAYAQVDGHMKLLSPATIGYRLPREAEWVYAARVVGRTGEARYPWGDGYPPKSKAGNFADAQIADTLANVVSGYNDGYRASAPVGSFSTQFSVFNDLGGNVAEWINDFYAVYPGQSKRLVKDPTGPVSGDHHVVRDSSWRDGSITELRLSYRDYSRGPRDDLGFRIARYADE